MKNVQRKKLYKGQVTFKIKKIDFKRLVNQMFNVDMFTKSVLSIMFFFLVIFIPDLHVKIIQQFIQKGNYIFMQVSIIFLKRI